jgi:amino acid permease
MKKVKKSTVITLALLVYITVMAIYFLPRNTEATTTYKWIAALSGYLIVIVLWLVLRRKERLQQRRKEEEAQYRDNKPQ